MVDLDNHLVAKTKRWKFDEEWNIYILSKYSSTHHLLTKQKKNSSIYSGGNLADTTLAKWYNLLSSMLGQTNYHEPPSTIYWEALAINSVLFLPQIPYRDVIMSKLFERPNSGAFYKYNWA